MDPLREIDNDLSIQKKNYDSQFSPNRIYPHSIQFLSYQPSIESFVSILKQT